MLENKYTTFLENKYSIFSGTHLIRLVLNWNTYKEVYSVALACLTAGRQVKQSKSDVPTAAETRANADKFGFKVFIPALTLALVAVLVATFVKALGANNAIGVSAAVALIVALCLFKAKLHLKLTHYYK